MRRPWQFREKAAASGGAFIASNLAAAVQAQLAWEEQGNTGYSPLALMYFGQALHTVTDAASPWHDDYNEVWGGGLLPTDYVHVAGEVARGPSLRARIALAEDEARKLWERFQLMLEEARRKAQEERKKKEEEEKKKKKTT